MSSGAEISGSLVPAKSSSASPGLVGTGKNCIPTLLNYCSPLRFTNAYLATCHCCAAKGKKRDLRRAHGPYGMETCACDICVF